MIDTANALHAPETLARGAARRSQDLPRLGYRMRRPLEQGLGGLGCAGSRILVGAEDERGLLDGYCRKLVEDGAYPLAWVGYATGERHRRVRPVASAGADQGFVAAAGFRWDASDWGCGPVGLAIRNGQPALCRDTAQDPGFAPWRSAALQLGLRSLIALPLRADGIAFGALAVGCGEPDGFDAEEVRMLTEMADDLADGVRNLRGEVAHRQAEGSRCRFDRTLDASGQGVTVTDAATGRPIVVVIPRCG